MKRLVFFLVLLLTTLTAVEALAVERKTATFTGFSARTLLTKEKQLSFKSTDQPSSVATDGSLVFEAKDDLLDASVSMTSNERFSGIVTVKAEVVVENSNSVYAIGFLSDQLEGGSSKDMENISVPNNLEYLGDSDNNWDVTPGQTTTVTVRTVEVYEGHVRLNLRANKLDKNKRPVLKVKRVTVLSGDVEKPVVTADPATVNHVDGRITASVSDPAAKLYYTYLWDDFIAYKRPEGAPLHGMATLMVNGIGEVKYGPTYFVWAEKDGQCSEPVVYRHQLQHDVQMSIPSGAVFWSYPDSRVASFHVSISDLTSDEEVLYSDGSENCFDQDKVMPADTTFKKDIIFYKGDGHAGNIYFHIHNKVTDQRSKVYRLHAFYYAPYMEADVTYRHTQTHYINYSYNNVDGPTRIRVTQCNLPNPTFHYRYSYGDTEHTGTFTDPNKGPIITQSTSVNVTATSGGKETSAQGVYIRLEDQLAKMAVKVPAENTVKQTNRFGQFSVFPASYLNLYSYYTIDGSDPETSDTRIQTPLAKTDQQEACALTIKEPGEYTISARYQWKGNWSSLATTTGKVIVGDNRDFGFKKHQKVMWAEDGMTSIDGGSTSTVYEPYTAYKVQMEGEDDEFINRYNVNCSASDRRLSVSLLWDEDAADAGQVVSTKSWYGGSPYFALSGKNGEAVLLCEATITNAETLEKMGFGGMTKAEISSYQALTVLGKWTNEERFAFDGTDGDNRVKLTMSNYTKGNGSITLPAGATITVSAPTSLINLRGIFFNTTEKEKANALVCQSDGYSYVAWVPLEGYWRKWMGRLSSVTFVAEEDVTISDVYAYYQVIDPKLELKEAISTVAVVGEDYDEPVLVNPYKVAVTYTSSNPSVATVDDKGNVTAVSAGDATIDIDFPGDDSYLPAHVNYNITVYEPLKKKSLSFDFGDPAGSRSAARSLTPGEGEMLLTTGKIEYANESGTGDGSLRYMSFIADGVTGSVYGTSNSNYKVGYYQGTDYFTMAGGAIINFSSDTYNLTRVTIELYDENDKQNAYISQYTSAPGTGQFDRQNMEWTGSAQSMELRLNSGDLRIRRILVYVAPSVYTIAETDKSYSLPYNNLFNVELKRTMKAGTMTTFSSPVSISAEKLVQIDADMKIYEYEAAGDSTVDLMPATNILAGRPYIVKPSKDIETIRIDNAWNDYLSYNTYSGDSPQVRIIGSTKATTLGKSSCYFVLDDNGTMTKLSDEEEYELLGMRAYFCVYDSDIQTITLLRKGNGDVNHDKIVNVVDVTSTIDHILGQTPEDFDEEAADVTGEGNINIVDVTTTIDKILNE